MLHEKQFYKTKYRCDLVFAKIYIYTYIHIFLKLHIKMIDSEYFKGNL